MPRAMILGCGVLVALACAGTATPGPSSAPAAPAALFVLEPGDACAWRLVTIGGEVRELARTEVCPEKLWFSPDSQRVVALGGGWAWHGPLAALVAVRTPPDAETVFPVRGEPMLARLDFGEPGTRLVTQRLDGAAFSPPVASPVSAGELMMGNPLGSHAEADAGWRSMHLREGPSKSEPLSDPSDGAKSAVRATSDAPDVGQLPVGESFLTYRVVTGDTPHPTPPLVWCDSEGCASATPLTGGVPDQITAEPAGDLVLITEEYSSARPTVYRSGVAAPIYVGPAGALGMWAPAGL